MRKQEENINTSVVRDNARQNIKIDEVNILGEPLWRQALRLKLSSALKSIEALRYDFKTKPSEKKQLDTVSDHSNLKRLICFVGSWSN